MDKDRLIAILREKMAAGYCGDPLRGASSDGVKDAGAISRLTAALSVPASFAELEQDLPPATRYLGPGAWMDAIRESAGQ
ncbi:hypothetical protein AGMMS50267_07440 [Spirochaetia bacterium]|nr:hypothetical protein AGMMS50267_07440 [Spirochaetia bacterium]